MCFYIKFLCHFITVNLCFSCNYQQCKCRLSFLPRGVAAVHLQPSKARDISHDEEFIGIVNYSLNRSSIRGITHFKRFSAKTDFCFLYPQLRKNAVPQTCSIQNRAYSIYAQNLHCLCSFRL